MESLSYWLRYVIFWTIFATVLTKKTEASKDYVSNQRTDERMIDMSPFVVPAISYYGVQYPVFIPDHQMFENLQEVDEDDEVQPPNVRSIKKLKSHKEDFKTTSPPARREVLLWPRPCGWEWDGNTYKWGPCNIFFGGPGFPW